MNVKEIRLLINKPTNIRNICLIGQMNSGKSTLINLFQNQIPFNNTQTIRSKPYLFRYKSPEDEQDFLINLLDTPGHIDFSSEVITSLRICDGAFLIIDCISGISIQTELVLRQLILERIKPIVFLNKFDEIFLNLQIEYEDIYQHFQRIIKNINSIGDLQIHPVKGTVSFGSCLHGWAFTLKEFADIYSIKFGIDNNKLMEYLWDDHFYSFENNQWSENKTEGYHRGFCQFILDPLFKIYQIIKNYKKDELERLMNQLNINNDKELSEKGDENLLKLIMKQWLAIDNILSKMIIIHLPSPIIAQKYRTEILYQGDEMSSYMKECDPDGPLMIYISKMIPQSDTNRFYAVGRIFSGIVRTNQTVRIMGPNFILGKKDDLFITNLEFSPIIFMGDRIESIDEIPCGNICGLIGIDRYLIKNGTITTYENAYLIRKMKFHVSPLVRVAVEPTNVEDLPKLIEKLKYLNQLDPIVECTWEESGEHIVKAISEYHLQHCLKTFKENSIKVSDPIISYCETVSQQSDRLCLSKSPNKHSRIYMTAQPLPNGLAEDIENDRIIFNQDIKTRTQYLVESYNFDVTDARKIWCFGPNENGPNMLIDCTKGVQYLSEFKDFFLKMFQFTTKNGILIEENLRNIRFDIHDITHTPDAIHRGGGQILPTIRRVMYASMLTAQPRLYQPIYLSEIQCSDVNIPYVYGVLNRYHGIISEQCNLIKPSHLIIKAYLPVCESFSFNNILQSNKIISQCLFDHWELINEDPLDETSNIRRIIHNIRKFKGLKEEIPHLNDYCDKL
ncbi:hypothetical protein I4U23_022281 [Adineta vaga]|nr:hypothetical protein I4U23_022281 [Adineta vaga]